MHVPFNLNEQSHIPAIILRQLNQIRFQRPRRLLHEFLHTDFQIAIGVRPFEYLLDVLLLQPLEPEEVQCRGHLGFVEVAGVIGVDYVEQLAEDCSAE